MAIKPLPRQLPQLHPGTAPFWLEGATDFGCVCVHGFTASPEEMRWLAEFLHARGLTVYVPRLAGHGTNPAQMARQHWHDWYENVLDAVALMRARCQTVYVVGLSMGGLLGLRIAAEQLVDGAVVLAAPVELDTNALKYARLIKYVQGYRIGDPGPLDQQVRVAQRAMGRDDYGRMAYGMTPIAAAAQLHALMQDVQATLAQVTVPLLVMYSKNDQTVPFRNLEIVRQGVSSTDLVVHVLEESDHVLTQDHERETVFAQIWDFLAARRAHSSEASS